MVRRLEPDADREVREGIIMLKRFSKAQKMADIIEGEGVTHEQAGTLNDDGWKIVIRAAGLQSASIPTRALTLGLLRDREERRHRD